MTFKNLAKKAKDRLSAAANTNEKTISMALDSKTSYYVVSSTIMKPEDDPLYNKVKKILEKDCDIINPIGKLIDHSVFDNLSPAEKDMYLLDLSKRYQKIKRCIQS